MTVNSNTWKDAKKICCLPRCNKAKDCQVPPNIDIDCAQGIFLCSTHGKALRHFQKMKEITENEFVRIMWNCQPKGISDVISIIPNHWGMCKHNDRRTCANCRKGNTKCQGIGLDKIFHLLQHDGTIKTGNIIHGSITTICTDHNYITVLFSKHCNNCNLNSHGVCQKCQQLYDNSLRRSNSCRVRKIEQQQQQNIGYRNTIRLLKKQLKQKQQRIKKLNLAHADNNNEKYHLLKMLKVALNENLLHSDHFFYKLLENTLANITQRRGPNGFRYREELIHWSILLRYKGGTGLWDTLRGKTGAKTNDVLSHLNLLIPSVSTLKRYLPQFSFGMIDDEALAQLTKAMHAQGVCSKVCISYDEMEIRSGLIFHRSLGQVIGFADENIRSIKTLYSERESSPVKPEDIARKVCQFFATSLDGKVAIPLGFWGHSSDHQQFITRKMTDIQSAFERTATPDYRLTIVAGSSDGFSGNQSFVESQTIIETYHHLFDFTHMLKRMRNTLLNREVKFHESVFCIETLVRVRCESGMEGLISEEMYSPSDRMEMAPVMKLLSKQLLDKLSVHKDANVRGLGAYLANMKKLYCLFRDDGDRGEKLAQIQMLCDHYGGWMNVCKGDYSNSPTKELFEHLLISMKSLERLLVDYADVNVKTCCLSTLIVENYFSVIRGKIRYPNMFEYETVQRSAWIALKAKMAYNTPFHIGGCTTSKYYNNVEVSMEYQPLTTSTPSSPEDSDLDAQTEEMSEFELMNEFVIDLCDEYLPRKHALLIREYFAKHLPQIPGADLTNRILLTCPLSGQCGVHSCWTYHGSFMKHLREQHSLTEDECRETLTRALLSAIESSQGSCTATDYTELINSVVNRLVGSGNDRSKLKIPSASGRLVVDSSLCDISVSSDEGDTSQTEQSGEYAKFILYDLETTGLWSDDQPPDLTEYCFIDISSGAFIQGLVRPSRIISPAARRETGITRELVAQSPDTAQSLRDIVGFCSVPTGTLVLVAHNGVRFDHKVLRFRMADVCMKFECNDTVFVDSIDILKGFKEKMPTNQKTKRKLYNQECVFKHLFSNSLVGTHCAFFDTVGLFRILLKLFDGNPKSLIASMKSKYVDKIQDVSGETLSSPSKRAKVDTGKCSCLTGCTTKHCSCVKGGRRCGETCKCKTCKNHPE